MSIAAKAMTLLLALSKIEQMETKCAFIHHRSTTNCRLLSLPRFSFTILEVLRCNIANRKTVHTCTHALHEQVLSSNYSFAFTIA